VRQLVLSCLQRRPEKRPSAAEVELKLRSLLMLEELHARSEREKSAAARKGFSPAAAANSAAMPGSPAFSFAASPRAVGRSSLSSRGGGKAASLGSAFDANASESQSSADADRAALESDLQSLSLTASGITVVLEEAPSASVVISELRDASPSPAPVSSARIATANVIDALIDRTVRHEARATVAEIIDLMIEVVTAPLVTQSEHEEEATAEQDSAAMNLDDAPISASEFASGASPAELAVVVATLAEDAASKTSSNMPSRPPTALAPVRSASSSPSPSPSPLPATQTRPPTAASPFRPASLSPSPLPATPATPTAGRSRNATPSLPSRASTPLLRAMIRAASRPLGTSSPSFAAAASSLSSPSASPALLAAAPLVAPELLEEHGASLIRPISPPASSPKSVVFAASAAARPPSALGLSQDDAETGLESPVAPASAADPISTGGGDTGTSAEPSLGADAASTAVPDEAAPEGHASDAADSAPPRAQPAPLWQPTALPVRAAPDSLLGEWSEAAIVRRRIRETVLVGADARVALNLSSSDIDADACTMIAEALVERVQAHAEVCLACVCLPVCSCSMWCCCGRCQFIGR
jgi:hypothetical protein